MQLLIYTPTLTNRISYIFKFIFADLLKVDYSITNNRIDFLQHIGAKMSYAPEPVAGELFFKASGLLTQSGVHELTIEEINYKDYRVCFPVSASFFPFDVFALSFFLVSRYEEYLPAQPDQYKRFKAENTLAFKLGFLDRPVVDEWAQQLKATLQQQWPGLEFGRQSYRFLPTVNIEKAYAYRSAGLIKNFAGMVKALVKLQFKKALKIPGIMLRLVNDPFDSYYFLDTVHREANVRPVFFFLLEGTGNIMSVFETMALRRLIKSLAGYVDMGVHPSAASNQRPELIVKEKTELEEILVYNVIRSRQHYLRVHLPKTYQNLVKAGIKHDHSMGFSSQPGFRAGTCTPFNWFDLSENEETTLRVYPFAVMELTLRQYQKQNPAVALATLKQLCDRVRNVNGLFITLWHNENLCETGVWKGWRQVYQDIVEYAAVTKLKTP